MSKKSGNDAIKERLAKKHLCYVLLTCDESTANGQMQVEMSYEGDPALASYLLHGAQSIIDEEVGETSDYCPSHALEIVRD